MPEGLEDMMISDLLIPNTKGWDLELLSDLFTFRDVLEITSIPLRHCAAIDTPVWHFEKTGCYSMKFGYMVAMTLFFHDETPSKNGTWNRIWNATIPPKVKSFIWRLYKGCLPTRWKLQQRGISVPIMYSACDNDVEHSWHIFISCIHAQSCLKECGLHILVNDLRATLRVSWNGLIC
ncbi:hypothetical protein PTKIN_Ptkin08bG0154500 [Pterospermum kingtungense]